MMVIDEPERGICCMCSFNPFVF